MDNLLNYKDFKKLNEATDWTTPGMKWNPFGGLLRLFKKGIALGKLNLYKQTLKNEYFAGVIRGMEECDYIMLKDGAIIVKSGIKTNNLPDPIDIDWNSKVVNGLTYNIEKSNYEANLKHIDSLSGNTELETELSNSNSGKSYWSDFKTNVLSSTSYGSISGTTSAQTYIERLDIRIQMYENYIRIINKK